MNNTYIFIIWNKALFCEKRIINDLSNSFTILKKIYIQWDKDKFKDNLKALYGYKATNLDYKINCIGKGKFCLLLVEDPNPYFEKKENNELININIYNKKWLYRKWTAGGFRIHSSVNEEETNHDLFILLNTTHLCNIPDNNNLLIKNTIGVNGFYSCKDLVNAISIFDKNISLYQNNNDLLIITKCRIDLLYFAFPNINDNANSFVIKTGNNDKIHIYIFGILENEVPYNCSVNEEFIFDLSKVKDDYVYFLRKKNISLNLKNFFEKYNMPNKIKHMNTKNNNFITINEKIKSSIKYLFFRCFSNNFFYHIKQHK